MTPVFHTTKPLQEVVHLPATASLAIENGAIVYRDPSTFLLKPASSQADQSSEPANQRLLARNFAGFANGQRLASQTTSGDLPVVVDGQIEVPCVSATFEVGDFVGADEAASGTALENHQVRKVLSVGLAIGVVVKRYSSATTKVWIRPLSRIGADGRDNTPTFKFAGIHTNVETLAADKTLTVTDAPVQVLDPGGSGRKVLLPPVADSEGRMIWIRNTADAAEILTVKDSADALTICTPSQNETALVICAGGVWYGIATTHN